MAEQRETVPQTRRVYLSFRPGAAGMAIVRLSLAPPTVGDALAVLISRGVIMDGAVLDVDLLSDPSADESLRGAHLVDTVTLAQTATVAIAAGVRTITLTGVKGVQAGDTVLLTPQQALPAGYLIGAVVASADGTLKVPVLAPVLAIGASYSIACKVIRVNL